MSQSSVTLKAHTKHTMGDGSKALPEFSYENGYFFRGVDLGGGGVKLELVHQEQGGGAIIMPPEKAKQCANWLLKTIGQEPSELPIELADILQRIIKDKNVRETLKRGEKKKIQDAVRVLRDKKKEN